MKKLVFPLIAIATVFYACGDSSESSPSKTEVPENSYASMEDLPNCSKKRANEVVFVEEDNTAYGCQDGQWKNLGEVFDTEEDLPNCSRSKEDTKVYLIDSEKSLVCDDGEWIDEKDLEPEEDDTDQESGENQDPEENNEPEEETEPSEEADDSSSSATPANSETDTSSSSSSETQEQSSSSSSSSSATQQLSSSSSSSSQNVVTPSSSSVQQNTGLITGTCGPLLSTITKNESATWRFTNSGTIQPTTYMWIFTNGSSVTSTAASPSITYGTVGTGTATLLLDAGLETESSISCSNLTVKSPAITGCSCSSTRMTTSNDLAVNDPVKYTWRVSGCSSEGSEPLSYSWSGSASGTGSSVVASYTSKGNYTASVTVTNTDNSSKAVSCSSISVEDSDNPYVETEWLNNRITLTAGSYYIPKCPGFDYLDNTAQYIISIEQGSSDDCLSWFDNQSTIAWSGGPWNTCNGNVRGVQFPLYITIPAGQSMRLYSCWR